MVASVLDLLFQFEIWAKVTEMTQITLIFDYGKSMIVIQTGNDNLVLKNSLHSLQQVPPSSPDNLLKNFSILKNQKS